MLPWHCWQLALEKKLQNLPVLTRNTIGIVPLLVVDTVLISLTAVSMWCFERCMALVNFHHSYLFGSWPKGIWGACHRTWKRKTLGGSWSRGSRRQHFLSFSWKSDSAWAFPPKPMAAGVPWALMSLTGPDQPLPCAQKPCFSSGLCTQSLPELCCGHVYLWPCLLDGHMLYSPSPVLPLTLVCWMDLGTGLLLRLVWGCWWDSLLCPMFELWRTAPCQWWHSLCWVTRGSWLVSAHGTVLLTLLRDTASTETEFMLCEESPTRNSVKPFRVPEVNRGVTINLCRISGLCNAKICNPGNRNSCIQLNWALIQLS